MSTLTGVASPAAGAGWSYPSPGVTLLSIRFKLVTSAAVANRVVTLSTDDGGGVPFWQAVFPAQAASLTVVYQCFVTAPRDAAVASGLINAPLPAGLQLNAQGVFRRLLCSVAAIDVADQCSEILLTAA
jgi:hypothetical protein